MPGAATIVLLANTGRVGRQQHNNWKIMHNQKKHNKMAQYSFAVVSTVLALVSARASELPTEKLNALQCTNNESESCCQKWVNIVLAAARVETNPASMLTVLPRRVDRWVIIEKRRFCDVKKDIEARAL
jgi:hypothetical protein